MITVGVPKERKQGEMRVAITPKSVAMLVANKINVIIETGAGVNCNYTDDDYQKNGATISSQEEVWESEVILKVKEPMPEEYPLFKAGQIIWGFLHLAANPECVEALKKSKVTAIASENMVIDGRLKLLEPVSKIAGRRALFTGLSYLESQNQGKGILLSGISETDGGVVTIVGGGIVGENAMQMALAIGAQVNLLELNKTRITQLRQQYPKANIYNSTPEKLAELALTTDVLISTILIPGARPPKIITKEITKNLPPLSVVVDVSSDQGGTCEALEQPTSHSEPIKIVDNVLYYAVPNMPGAVPITASQAIQGVMKYVIELNQVGIHNINDISEINSGLQLFNGKIINENLN